MSAIGGIADIGLPQVLGRSVANDPTATWQATWHAFTIGIVVRDGQTLELIQRADKAQGIPVISLAAPCHQIVTPVRFGVYSAASQRDSFPPRM